MALFAVEALVQQGLPVIHWWALPVLAWGYLQYRLVGNYRTRLGGGGPGISIPPDRVVDTGIYRWVRNPMYLGHIIFLAGIALVLGSWIAAIVLILHLFWFQGRVREDERHLLELFGEPYRDYCRRVKRWVPGIL
ncbi:MAG: isoprenylcysteine carboxylmethyltransferase family protein [Usitatibacter sp.]